MKKFAKMWIYKLQEEKMGFFNSLFEGAVGASVLTYWYLW